MVVRQLKELRDDFKTNKQLGNKIKNLFGILARHKIVSDEAFKDLVKKIDDYWILKESGQKRAKKGETGKTSLMKEIFDIMHKEIREKKNKIADIILEELQKPLPESRELLLFMSDVGFYEQKGNEFAIGIGRDYVSVYEIKDDEKRMKKSELDALWSPEREPDTRAQSVKPITTLRNEARARLDDIFGESDDEPEAIPPRETAPSKAPPIAHDPKPQSEPEENKHIPPPKEYIKTRGNPMVKMEIPNRNLYSHYEPLTKYATFNPKVSNVRMNIKDVIKERFEERNFFFGK